MDESYYDRVLEEIEALKVIYEDALIVHSSSATTTNNKETVRYHYDLHFSLTTNDNDNEKYKLRCTLPFGYPETMSAKVFVTATNWTRTFQDEITARLQEKANNLLGFESVMNLIQDLQEIITDLQTKNCVTTLTMKEPDNKKELDIVYDDDKTEHKKYGRRWIWVHHITDIARRKAIVTEASELNLNGYLKSGYPGIILIEGVEHACDEFVTWIKGNKSRPGGFGRNWGHHVRGQISFSNMDDCKLYHNINQNLGFTELVDNNNMKKLGALCKDFGLEEEFLTYAMQHYTR